MKKIVILDGYTENPGDLSWEPLTVLGDLTVYDRSPLDNYEETAKRIGDASYIFTNKTPITKAVLEDCNNLEFIGVLATGYNVVDIKAAKDKGILVSNIPTYGTNAVGQFALALLLETCHHIGHHNESVHSGKWTSNPDWCYWDYPLIELAGKTMGIIGYGRIGQTTSRLAKALEMNIIGYDKFENPELVDEQFRYGTLDEIYKNCDIITLHCPLIPETEGLINKESINKMKDGVIIINNSRGPLIVEQDLANALNSGKVFCAGLDVVSTEPIKEDNPLLSAKNCIITPHISWAPKESRQRLLDIAVDNLKKYIEGNPQNIVNL